MISVNEFGNKCIKCGNWVNPFKGISILFKENVLCRECEIPSIEKLKQHINIIMGVKDDTTSTSETSQRDVDC